MKKAMWMPLVGVVMGILAACSGTEEIAPNTKGNASASNAARGVYKNHRVE